MEHTRPWRGRQRWRRRLARLALGVGLLVAPSGCLVLTFASPPIAATAGLGLPAGTVLEPRRSGLTPATPEVLFALPAV